MGMFLTFCQESPLRNFSIPEGIAPVIHCRRTNGRGTAMSNVDEFDIGYFGHKSHLQNCRSELDTRRVAD
jgi:hypothetical protein